MKLLTIDEITREFAYLLSKEDIPKEKFENYDVTQRNVGFRVMEEYFEDSLESFSNRLIKPSVAGLVNYLKLNNLILLYDVNWNPLGDYYTLVKLGLGDSTIDIRGAEGVKIVYNGIEHMIRFDVMCKESK